MIVARITNDQGTPQVQAGSCKIDRYDGKDKGWFPIDSFDFGFNPKQDDSNDSDGAHPSQTASGKQPAPAKLGGGKKGAGHKQFAEVAITKAVDTATVTLMVFAMRERKTKKGVGDQSTPLQADIHVISSVAKDVLKGDRFHYTSLMIHLEAVHILNWKINASGDSRPTENLSLGYDRAHIYYVTTADGKTFMPVGPNGWDQTTNDSVPWKNFSQMEPYKAPM